jgi:hypothetical protein
MMKTEKMKEIFFVRQNLQHRKLSTLWRFTEEGLSVCRFLKKDVMSLVLK